MLSVINRYAEGHFAECHYVESRYAGCHYEDCREDCQNAECRYAVCCYAECRGVTTGTEAILLTSEVKGLMFKPQWTHMVKKIQELDKYLGYKRYGLII